VDAGDVSLHNRVVYDITSKPPGHRVGVGSRFRPKGSILCRHPAPYSGQAPRSDHSSSIAWYFPVLSSSFPRSCAKLVLAPAETSGTPRPRSRLRVFSRYRPSLSVSICGPQRFSASNQQVGRNETLQRDVVRTLAGKYFASASFVLDHHAGIAATAAPSGSR